MRKIAPYEKGVEHPFLGLLRLTGAAGETHTRLVLKGIRREFDHVRPQEPYSQKDQEALILNRIKKFQQETTGREQKLWEDLYTLIDQKPEEKWLEKQQEILHQIAEERKKQP